MTIKEFVNEEKRTCVVVLSDFEDDVSDRINNIVDKRYLGDILFLGNLSKIPCNKVIGKAKCSPNDEFSAATGINLARARAFYKYKRLFNDQIYALADRITDFYHEILSCKRSFLPEGKILGAINYDI